ncbi:MAG: hypothetical protein JWN79_2261 [Gemmatimonadetes bacterium]|jgi:hypothetical protein|nr:hypothetical protein [Gemmatimonadota bacterium]
MLSLESSRWGTLQQAYGSAEDVPRLIAALGDVPEPEARAQVWFALWRMLWRPDAVFDAAYAAVPHLLAIAEALTFEERIQAIHLALRVELLRRGPTAPPMPAGLVGPYGAAIDGLAGAVFRCSGEPWPAEVAQIFAAALLVGKRQAALAAEVLALGEE